MDEVNVRFLDPAGMSGELTLRLPRDTRFSELTAILAGRSYLEPQRGGYRYLYQEHLCGMHRRLGDYLPAEAGEMELELFRFPAVLV